jgi:hypothetical protein
MPFPFAPGEILTATNLNDAVSGWMPIETGTPSAAATFTVTIPASTYKMVRITIQGAVASGANVALTARVNGDSTAALHAYYAATMVSDAVSTVTSTATGWVFGWVNTNQGNVAELLIFNTDVSSACPFKSTAASYHGTEANGSNITAGGQLAANRLLSSVVIFPASSTFTGSYVAEGYVVP